MNINYKIYKNRYKVFEDGKIIGVRNKELKKRFNKSGYIRASIYHNKERKEEFVHKIVASLFIPNPENKTQVNHINGVKTDNRVENLEWCTASENTRHAWDIGLMENVRQLSCEKAKRMGDKYGKLNGKYSSKKVINTKTGKIYPSAKIVAKKIGVNYATFKNWMNGRSINKTNFKYL